MQPLVAALARLVLGGRALVVRVGRKIVNILESCPTASDYCETVCGDHEVPQDVHFGLQLSSLDQARPALTTDAYSPIPVAADQGTDGGNQHTGVHHA